MNPTAGRTGYVQAAVTQVLATTPAIDIKELEFGHLHIPTGSGITAIAWHVLNPDGTYSILHTTAGVAVSQTVSADKVYRLPPEVEAAGWVKARSTFADGTIYISGKLRF